MPDQAISTAAPDAPDNPPPPGSVRVIPAQALAVDPVADQQLRSMVPGLAQPVSAAAPPPTPSETPFPPPAGAQGAPASQGVPTTVVSSEPTPAASKPVIDPRPYAYFQQHDPQYAQVIDDVAQMTGVSPFRIAAHKWAETRTDMNPAKRGAAGEIGPLQLMPGTIKELDPSGRLDPFDVRDNTLLGAMYMAKGDAKYGKDSPSSIAAYNGGLGGVGKLAAQRYAQNLVLGGDNLTSKDFVGQGSSTPQGLVQAGVSGGPTGFLRYMAQTAPRGMGVSDQWRHAEDLLTSAFVAKGDLAGAQHARDFILQMSHVGANQYLMQAHQALSNGDGIGAAQALAKAHAFFPDDTIGRFRSDGKNVYAERVDEHDPSRRIGEPFMVTANDIAGQLNQTTNPAQYLQNVMAQQKATAYARHLDAMSQYYADLPAERREAAETRANAQVESARARAGGTVQAAEVRAGQNSQLDRAIDKETTNVYNSENMPNTPQAALGRMAEAHATLRREGMTPPQAQAVTQGLSDKTLHLLQTTNGNFAVAGKDGKPVAYISRAAAASILGPAAAAPEQSQKSPIGAAAGTPYMVGMTSNLAGTQPAGGAQPQPYQSSAIPTQQGQ